MRLTYLDILEQCFHDKFRGYNKQEVDTFLHLVADDFKSMAEDIKEKDRQINFKTEEIKELHRNLEELSQTKLETRTSPEVEEELRSLQKELAKKDLIIDGMKNTEKERLENEDPLSQLTPEKLKEKAKIIINAAKQHAEEYKANAAEELDSLQFDILKLQRQKQQLMDNIRATAVEHLSKFKAGSQNGNAGKSAHD